LLLAVKELDRFPRKTQELSDRFVAETVETSFIENIKPFFIPGYKETFLILLNVFSNCSRRLGGPSAAYPETQIELFTELFQNLNLFLRAVHR
jgi:hypothetical protein